MEILLLANEQEIRLAVFCGMLFLMSLIELAVPFRASRTGLWRHRLANLSVSAINTLVLLVIFPFLAVGMAHKAQEEALGLFNLLDLPLLLEFVLAVLIMDFAIYGQHILTHKVPILWRFHAMHHVDRDLDATTGIRFHPLEIVFSMILKFLLVIILGPAPAAVMLFEVILNATSLFNHSNLRFPRQMEKVIRFFIITPEMHRVHHSVHRDETDSNYGFSLSCWDRLFGTYKNSSVDGDDGLTIGLPDQQMAPSANPLWMLMFPFRR